jgi:hypothetical protein
MLDHTDLFTENLLLAKLLGQLIQIFFVFKNFYVVKHNYDLYYLRLMQNETNLRNFWVA